MTLLKVWESPLFFPTLNLSQIGKNEHVSVLNFVLS